MLQRPPDNSEAAAASNALSHVKYRPDIDGLLAVAVLSVVFFHAFPDYPAPVRNAGAERELTMMRWGMPPPAEVRQRLKTEASNASGPNLTVRFAWGFPEALAYASLGDARANEDPIEPSRPQQA
jgi:hypothetical protein